MARRSRVMSFMSQWSSEPRSTSEPPLPHERSSEKQSYVGSQPIQQDYTRDNRARGGQDIQHSRQNFVIDQSPPASPSAAQRSRAGSRASARPLSMIQTFQPPLMDVAQDTLPELQPIFTFLNSHSNKLYQEGYFLKLHDLDTKGRPSPDRDWQECFAQLAGTVLSLWDAAALDAAGEDGEVIPTFINLADASIKMLGALPMNEGGQVLNNVLSISTAANNRYLLHFNSLNSLTQWTAGIRLALFEHSGLQEAYTGSLIAGKGRSLNNIRTIMDRTKFKTEDWCRVRFGAGTPWRRCWFVISPPDEKEVQKMKKIHKKASPYDKVPILKGDLKFYESKKITKKTRPIATVTDAWSAYAVYPQSKPLIDQSTLVKVEGRITIHSSTESSADGFVFVMPEVRPAVSGFEIMLRFLFPVWDIFALYGRPNKLIAETLDTRGLMFAMPKERNYGYLELLDVCGLIHGEGAQTWSERRWRQAMKELTSRRMLALGDDASSDNSQRNSGLPQSRSTLRFDDPSSRSNSPGQLTKPRPNEAEPRKSTSALRHQRSNSEAIAFSPPRAPRASHDMPRDTNGFGQGNMVAPPPPMHQTLPLHQRQQPRMSEEFDPMSERESAMRDAALGPELRTLKSPPPAPVAVPPNMAHMPSERPPVHLNQAPELRRGQSYLDQDTINQMVQATTPGVEPRVNYGFPDHELLPGQPGLNGRYLGEQPAVAGAVYRGVGNAHNESQRVSANENPQGLLNSSSSTAPPRQPPSSSPSRFAPVQIPASATSSTVEQPSKPSLNTSDLSSIRGALDITSPTSPSPIDPSLPRITSQFNTEPVPTGLTPSVLSDTLGDPFTTANEPQLAFRPKSTTNFSVRRKPISRTTSAASVDQSLSREISREADQHPNMSAGGVTQLFYANARNVIPLPYDDGKDRPRMGKLKTTGIEDGYPTEIKVGEAAYKGPSLPTPPMAVEVPTFDFGPTFRLDPGAKQGPKLPYEPVQLPSPPRGLSPEPPLPSKPTSRPSSRPTTNPNSRPVSRAGVASHPGTSHGPRAMMHTPTGSMTHLPLTPTYSHQGPMPPRSQPRISPPGSRGRERQYNDSIDREAQHRHILANLDMIARDLPTWTLGPQDIQDVSYDGMRVPAVLHHALQQFRPRSPQAMEPSNDGRDRAEKARIFQLSNTAAKLFQEHQRQHAERQMALQQEVSKQQQIVMQQQNIVQMELAQAAANVRPRSGSIRNKLQKRLSGSRVFSPDVPQQQQPSPMQLGGRPLGPDYGVVPPPSYHNVGMMPTYQNQQAMIPSPVSPFTQPGGFQQEHGARGYANQQMMPMDPVRSSSSGSLGGGMERPRREHRGPPKSYLPFMGSGRSRSNSRER